MASSEAAAWINGAAAHALDFDDVALGGHPSTVLVPAILAEAQRLAVARALRNEEAMSSTSILAIGILSLIIVLLVIWTMQSVAERKARKAAEQEADRRRREQSQSSRKR